MPFYNPDENNINQRCSGVRPCKYPEALSRRGRKKIISRTQRSFYNSDFSIRRPGPLVEVGCGWQVRTNGVWRMRTQDALEALIFALGEQEAQHKHR